jgi:hypothetical protein
MVLSFARGLRRLVKCGDYLGYDKEYSLTLLQALARWLSVSEKNY